MRGFFKGMTSPLVGSAWTNAIMFATYERSLQLIDPTPQTPTLQSVFYAGTIGGFCQTVALTPTELIKCRLQVQDGHESSRYRGPWDCVKHIYQRNGLRGLFLGYTCTLWREVPSFAFYFSMYEYTKRKMIAHGINPHTSMLTAGGLAGLFVAWLFLSDATKCCFETVLKSSIQTLPIDHRPGEHKMAYQARRLYRLGGLRTFVNGLETAVVRAFPVNAVTFYCYEKTSESLKGLTRD
ncbi:hypothetical protein BBJ28_00023021 [Nothophytophthora sp. Chile5]|nr:hypothetical protein BBJ28_00023021 [Nothophytophthora sp. Chile5]